MLARFSLLIGRSAPKRPSTSALACGRQLKRIVSESRLVGHRLSTRVKRTASSRGRPFPCEEQLFACEHRFPFADNSVIEGDRIVIGITKLPMK